VAHHNLSLHSLTTVKSSLTPGKRIHRNGTVPSVLVAGRGYIAHSVRVVRPVCPKSLFGYWRMRWRRFGLGCFRRVGQLFDADDVFPPFSRSLRQRCVLLRGCWKDKDSGSRQRSNLWTGVRHAAPLKLFTAQSSSFYSGSYRHMHSAVGGSVCIWELWNGRRFYAGMPGAGVRSGAEFQRSIMIVALPGLRPTKFISEQPHDGRGGHAARP
jgi:hypothetical protein